MTSFNSRAWAGVFMAWIAAFSTVAAGEKESVGYLASVRGDVFVDGAPARTGTRLYASSRVRTGNGKAAVLLAGESVIQLSYDSELEIKSVLRKPNQGLSSEVELDHGKIRTLVRDKGTPKQFQIRTRSAVMGVRGTEVFIDTPKGSGPSFFATIEGSATVTPVAAPGAPAPQPVPLPQNQAFGGGAQGTQALSGQQTRELASSVAPPRAETFVVSEVLSSAAHGSEPVAAPPPQSPQTTGPKLDPVVNSPVSAARSGSAILVPTSKKL